MTGSIHLKSHVTLSLEPGSIIEASADPATYDAAEPNAWDKFQDFGHSHFHNSLIWGENLEDIAITGSGLISGKALVRERGGAGRQGHRIETVQKRHATRIFDSPRRDTSASSPQASITSRSTA